MENRRGKHTITYLGSIPQSEVIALYQKASIFVLPSFWEGLPVTVLEALACEAPVIATPVGGIPDIIRHAKTGMLTPVGDPLKLARAIQYLLTHKEIGIALGRAGRAKILREFSIEVIAQELRSIYEKILE